MEQCLKALYSFDDPELWELCSDSCLCHRYDFEERKCPTSRVVHTHCLHWVTYASKTVASTVSSTFKTWSSTVASTTARTTRRTSSSYKTTSKIWSTLTKVTTTAAPTTTTSSTTPSTAYDDSPITDDITQTTWIDQMFDDSIVMYFFLFFIKYLKSLKPASIFKKFFFC